MNGLSSRPTVVNELLHAVRAAPNGEVQDVERAIAAYEKKFGMSSGAAIKAIERGELRPTQEVEGWMMAIRVRDHLVDAKARAR